MGIGARFYKADLHIHTPFSDCYPCKTDKPEDIIEAAKAQGLEIIAITDHNQFEAIKDIKSLAVKNGIVVFPGLEITTENCHIIALFDPTDDDSVLDDVLTECGIGKNKNTKRGDANCTGYSALKVLDKIRMHKGIGIAAHCDIKGNSPLFQLRSNVMNKILKHDCLCALEICDLATAEKYLSNNINVRRIPIVQSSDAHQLNAIGTRYTYLKMDRPTLEGLKLALLEPQTRIRLMDGTIDIKFPYIQNISIDRGFFGGKVFDFSPYLTCLIGGTGTGKSTIIECLRYCFNDLSTEKEIRDDTYEKLKKLVGSGGMISVKYQTEYGEIVTIRREVTGDPKNDQRIPMIVDAAGNDIALLTKPKFYSQGEIALIARRQTLQMNLIDSNLDLSEDETLEKELLEVISKLSNRIVENVQQIQTFQDALDDLDTGKKITEKRIKELKKILSDKIFEVFPKWEKEKRLLDTPTKVLEKLKTAVSQFKEEFKNLSSEFQSIKDDTPNYSSLKSINEYKNTLDTKVDSTFDILLAAIAEIEGQFQSTKLKWEVNYNTKKAEYFKLLEGIKEDSIKEAQSNYRSCEKKLDQLRECERRIVELNKVKRKDFAERTTKVEELLKVRDKRYFKRDKLAKDWSAGLKRTHVAIKRAADNSSYLAKIDKALSGSNINRNDKATIIDKLNPRQLFKLVWDSNHEALGTKCDFNEDKAKKIIDFLRADLNNLLTVDIVDMPDSPDIRFTKKPGVVEPLEHLSTGEKSIALLSIAMMESNCPIVIDQPEDSLDTRFIYEEIVSKLKRQKEQRQFICTSHNANIVISADSDLTHVLDATVDQGIIESSGGIEDQKTNSLMLMHLEGGETAFRLRTKKYIFRES